MLNINTSINTEDQARWTWTAIMLVTSNIFLTNVYSYHRPPLSLQQNIYYVKVLCRENENNYSWVKSIAYLLGEERSIYLFLFFTYIFKSYPPKYPQEKKLYHETCTRRTFVHTKYPWEKISDPRKTQRRDGSRPMRPVMARNTEFSTLT